MSGVDETSAISAETMAEWWQQAPDAAVAGRTHRISAAIWSGGPREIWAPADPTTTVIGMPLQDYECEVFVDGRVVSDKTWRPGEVQMMTAGVVPRAVLRTPWSMLHVYLPNALVEAAVREMEFEPGIELRDPLGAADSEFAGLLYSILRELKAKTPPSQLLLDAYGAQLAVHIVRRWSSRAEAGSAQREHRGGLPPRVLARVVEYCWSRIAEDVTLAELAGVAGLSPFHFLRAFKRSMGMTPFACVVRKRVQRAQELMRAHPAMGLAEIALAVGYSDQPAFGSAFKRVTGATPGEWRRAV